MNSVKLTNTLLAGCLVLLFVIAVRVWSLPTLAQIDSRISKQPTIDQIDARIQRWGLHYGQHFAMHRH